MVQVNVNSKERTADFAVEQSCPSCGGTLDVRLTPGNAAWIYCGACHWLARSQVSMEGNMLQVAPASAAEA